MASAGEKLFVCFGLRRQILAYEQYIRDAPQCKSVYTSCKQCKNGNFICQMMSTG
jgi:hypothetical protein